MAVILTAVALSALVLRLSAADAQPVVTAMYPEDGDVLAEPPPRLQMCFEKAVDVSDQGEGGKFGFRITTPDGRALGHRTVFQRDGFGVMVQPGLPSDAPAGEWTFEWLVADAETGETATAVVKFTVDPEGEKVFQEQPFVCNGGKSPPRMRFDVDSAESDGNDGSDIPLVALVAAGAAGVVVLGLVLFLVRRRIRRSSPRGGGGGSGGH